MAARPAAILFDWDGTLFDAVPLCTAATNLTLQGHGYRAVSEHDIHHGMQYPTPERFAFHITGTPSFSDAVTREAAHAISDEFYGTAAGISADYLRLFDGVGRMLAELAARDIPCGIVSNNQRSVVEPLLRDLGIDSCFQAIIGAEDVDAPKPSAEPSLACLASLAVAPGPDVFFVGDLPTDEESARAASVVPIGAGWPETSVVRTAANPYAHVVWTPETLLDTLTTLVPRRTP